MYMNLFDAVLVSVQAFEVILLPVLRGVAQRFWMRNMAFSIVFSIKILQNTPFFDDLLLFFDDFYGVFL